MRLIPDAIRYAFQYHEADYARHLREDVALTQQQGFELVRLRNFWPGDQYKGVSSLWRAPAAGQFFEVQFHTEVSYHAMVFTAEHTCARLRSAQTCAREEIELEAFQREVYAHVPVPPGADGIPGFPPHAGWQVARRQARRGVHPGSCVASQLAADLCRTRRPGKRVHRDHRARGRPHPRPDQAAVAAHESAACPYGPHRSRKYRMIRSACSWLTST